MNTLEDEVLTMEETIQLLKIGRTTLYKLAREGKILAFKIGREWRFIKEQLIERLKEKSHNK